MPDGNCEHNTVDTTNCAEIAEFLRQFDPTGWHNLVAIHPDTRAVSGKTFAPGALQDAAAWATRMNEAGRNVYFTVNEPAPDAPDDKLRKEHIASIRAVFVDADPKKDKPFAIERQRVLGLAEAAGRAVRCRPTHIVDSGGGVQLFWRLADKLPADQHRTWAENQGRALAFATGGDAVQNIDRIMRLPGTTNYPDEAKRNHGRTPTQARALPFDAAAPYAPEQLSAYAPPRPAEDRLDNSEEIAAIQAAIDMRSVEHGPDDDLTRKLNHAAARDPRLKAILDGEPLRGDDQTGSAYRTALVARICLAGGFTPTEYATIAHSLPHCRTKEEVPGGWPRQYAREWCNVGVKCAVEHWFSPIPDDEPNPFEEAAYREAQEREARHDASRFQFISLHEAAELALGDSAEPLIEGLLDAGACSVLYGESNVGKTFVALDMAFHIWAGLPYAGMPTTQASVVYVAAEGGAGILKRARALMLEKRPERIGGFHILRSSVNMLDPDADMPALVAAINSVCPEGAGLIVIDTLSRSMAGGDENSSTDMGRLVSNMDALRKATRAHGMWVHHSGKNKANGARGHSLLRAAIDTELEVEEGRIAATKQRDLECGWSVGFALKSVALGLDGQGRPLSSAVVELRQDGSEAGREGAKLTALQSEVLSAVAVLTSTNTERRGPTTAEVGASLEGKRAYGSVRNALSALAKIGMLEHGEAGFWVLKRVQDVPKQAQGGVFD